MSDWYKSILKETKGIAPLQTAIVHAVGPTSITGAIAAAKLNIITPLFVGPEQRVKSAAAAAGVDLSPYEIINSSHSENSVEQAVQLINAGKAEALMKGEIHTDEMMHIIVKKESCLRTARRMSHVFIVDAPYYHKPLFLTDAAINIFPDLAAKTDIVQNAIDLFIALGFGTPKVAILSATENVYSAIPSTLDATALCKMSERGQIVGGVLDGPLSFDLAISKESVKIKGLKSAVAGDADILVVPDLESGNMLYKQMAFLSHAESAGIVLGARVPIILTSRSDDALCREASCAIALLFARRKKLT